MTERWVFDDILEGLSIIRRYCNQRPISASIEEFFAGNDEANPTKLDDRDFARLEELGWYWCEKLQCWEINLP